MNARQHRDQEGNRRWGSRSSKERPKRPFRTTVLVFCEGRETEPNYFRSLRAEDNVALRFDVTVKGGKGGSRLQIVQAAVEHIAKTSKRYDQTYLILDTERLDSPEAIKDFGDAMSLAKQNDINTRLSNPSFEVWFLSHLSGHANTSMIPAP